MPEGNRSYWYGNAAKSWIVRDLLRRSAGEPRVTVCDLGCGEGGDWPAVLADHPELELIGYDPSPKSVARARERLSSTSARLFTGPHPPDLPDQVDFVVSLSVLEHVRDRRNYLATAGDSLKAGGVFYLTYDDGHFRNLLDLQRPRTWVAPLAEAGRTLLSGPLARMGKLSGYLRRVTRPELDHLLREAGLEVESSFYSNLQSLKLLSRTIPPPARQDFMSFWIEVEQRLNSDFRADTQVNLHGDAANLWTIMVSRTLVLTRRGTRTEPKGI